MKYSDYAKKNDPTRTDSQIDEMVGGLFGADAEMGEPIEKTATYTKYEINGYYLYSNNSSFDTVEIGDDDDSENPLEQWNLEY
jgi:hypothetical protein